MSGESSTEAGEPASPAGQTGATQWRVWSRHLVGVFRTLARVTVGDRLGGALFLGSLCVFGLYWRAGPFITDTATIVATLDALAQGRLWIDQATGAHFSAPGAVVNEGMVYGRNYGQVALAMPVLLALDGLSAIADLRVGLTALWHLAVLGLLAQVTRLLDVRPAVTVAGCLAVVASFGLNLTTATQFVEASRSLLALQISTMVFAGMLAATVYRLVAWRYDTRLGLVAGGASVVVLPVGFWAGFPKRHVLVALLVVGLLYAFARSRTAERPVAAPYIGRLPGFRALAYALVGLLAWVHAGEAVFVFAILVAVDVPTAPSNDWRILVALAGVFALALLPTFVTNGLVGGNPLLPPRLLEPASTVAPADAGASGIGGQVRPGATPYTQPLDVSFLPGPIEFIATVVVGGTLGLTELERLSQTWLRSGSAGLITGGHAAFAGANLTVLESIPVFGAFLAVIVTAGRRFRGSIGSIRDALEATDALAVGITGVFVLMYTPRLPTHVQISVRYLLPAYPLLLYLLVRTPAVRRLLTDRSRLVGWSYAGGVLVGTQFVLAYVVLQDLTVAGAVQVHARIGLALAGLLAIAVVVAEFDDRAPPLAAVALGLAAASGTAFILLAGLGYFSFVGEFVLPVADRVAALIGRF